MDSKQREILFLEMAERAGGTTAQDVFEAAGQRGSSVTVEAFHNLGRRLVARGALAAVRDDDGRTRYTPPAEGSGQWLDEDEIETMVDREDPVVSLAVAQEAARQLRDLPEGVWHELRLRLQRCEARAIFRDAIIYYCHRLHDEVQHLKIQRRDGEQGAPISKQEKTVNDLLQLLRQLVRFGLGLSKEAVFVPPSLKVAEDRVRLDALLPEPFYDQATLERELASRIEPGAFVKQAEIDAPAKMIVAAVDSSIRGGLMTRDAEQTEFTIGAFPQVTVTTAVAETNMEVKQGGRMTPVFCRLPERPEDVQRDQNKYTVSAKIFYPDITDTEYVHLTWNAMDVLEGRMILRVLRPWFTSPGDLEVAAADVVMKDGALAPQDRDFSHYRQQDSYGTVVRDLIRANGELVHQLEAGGQTVAGVVKKANLRVIAPILNWFAFDVARSGSSQLKSWSMPRLGAVDDQTLISQLLTAGRTKGEAWMRSCLVLRPFHATTKFAHTYSRGRSPKEEILADAARYAAEEYPERLSPEEAWMGGPAFKGANDPYVRMLENCWYAGFYLAAVARLDTRNHLPRFEFIIPHATSPDCEFDWDKASEHCDRLIGALKAQGFEVSADSSFFNRRQKIDVVPAMIARVHERVRTWSRVLGDRMNELVAYYVGRMIGGGAQRGIHCRPWTSDEFQSFKQQIARERTLQEPGHTAVHGPE